jgi:hypothetical protein
MTIDAAANTAGPANRNHPRLIGEACTEREGRVAPEACSFALLPEGNGPAMAPILILAIVLIVFGLLGLLFFPWGGIVVAIVGVALLLAFVGGFGKRAAEPLP